MANKLKVLVVGPQHSGTRLFAGLIDRHPDVGVVDHLSVPHGSDDGFAWDHFAKYSDEYDRVVIVSRDITVTNLSNIKDYSLKDIGDKANKLIVADLQRLNGKLGVTINTKIVFASYETLICYGKHYLRSLLHQCGLSPQRYDWNLTGIHQPLNEDGSKRWFRVDLNIKDENKKYFK